MVYKNKTSYKMKQGIVFYCLLNFIMSCGSRATLNKPVPIVDSVTISTFDSDLDTVIDQNTTTYKSIIAQRFSYEFKNVPFFKVYDSLNRQWGMTGGYSSILRDGESLLQPVNMSVVKATPAEVLRILFKGQPLLEYSYEIDENTLTIFTNKVDAFLNIKAMHSKRKFKN